MVGPLTPPKSEALHHDGEAVGELDLIRPLVGDHALQCKDIVENRFYVSEDNAGLILVLGQAHNRQCFTDGHVRSEVDETGDEACNQSRYKRLAAPSAYDQVRFLEDS